MSPHRPKYRATKISDDFVVAGVVESPFPLRTGSPPSWCVFMRGSRTPGACFVPRRYIKEEGSTEEKKGAGDVD